MSVPKYVCWVYPSYLFIDGSCYSYNNRGDRHFLEGRTRFQNHSDFSEINDFIRDFRDFTMIDSHGARTGPEASSSVNWMVKVISSLESSLEAKMLGPKPPG